MSGDTGSTSITSQYVAGTSYSFALKVEFSRKYIGQFRIQVKISEGVHRKYLGSMNGQLMVEVNPSYLSVAERNILI